MRLLDESANWRPQGFATGRRYAAGFAAMSYAGLPRCGELSVTIEGTSMRHSSSALNPGGGWTATSVKKPFWETAPQSAEAYAGLPAGSYQLPAKSAYSPEP